MIIAEAEGDSAGQPEQKLYKAIGQIVIAAGEISPNGYQVEFILVLSGEKVKEYAVRAKTLERLGISALHISEDKGNDEWLFGK